MGTSGGSIVKRAGAFAVAVLAMALAGCTSTALPPEPTPTVEPLVAYSARELGPMQCGVTRILPEALTDPRPGTDVDPEIIAGVEATGWLERPIADWSVASESSKRLVLWREMAEGEAQGLIQYDYEMASFILNAGVWSMEGTGACALLIDLGGLIDGTISFDPEKPPLAGDTTLHLLIMENSCAGGKNAEGRVEVVEVREFTDAVELVVGLRPLSGAATCPTHPPTPFEVELKHPLGDRILLDGVKVPALEVARP